MFPDQDPPDNNSHRDTFLGPNAQNWSYVSVAEAGSIKTFDLKEYIDEKRIHILNSKNPDLTSKLQNMESAVDEELLILVHFKEKVKLQGIKISVLDVKSGPKIVHLYANRPLIDFTDLDQIVPDDTLNLSLEDLAGKEQKVKVLKFQNLDCLTLYVQSNQRDYPVTSIQQIVLIGFPAAPKDLKVPSLMNPVCNLYTDVTM